MSITYDSITKIITVSGETNCNFEKLYQASVAGGWSVIEKPYENVYYINAFLYLYSNTTFVDTFKTVFFNGYLIYQTNTNMIYVGTGCTLTLGNLADATQKIGNRGCDIKFIHIIGVPGRPLIFNSGTINLFGCKISADSDSSVYFWSTGVWKVYSCFLNSVQLEQVNNINNDIANSLLLQVNTYASVMQLSYVRFLYGVPQYGNSQLTLTSCDVINPTPLAELRGSAGSYIKLIDTFSTSYSYTLGTGADYLSVSYTVVPTILDINKNPIAGCSIKLFDELNNLVIDAISNASGTIIPIPVMIKKVQSLGGGQYEITEHNPFTLVVSKDGYETYTSTFDLTEKYRSIITLTPPEYIYVDKISIVEKLTTKINNESIMANIVEETIYAQIINEN